MPPRPRKPPAAIVPLDDPAAVLPDAVHAAMLAYSILRQAKLGSWAQLAASPEAISRVRVSSVQQACLDRHGPLLAWVRVVPLRLPYVCSGCGRVGFVGKPDRGQSGASRPMTQPPARCRLRAGCEGRPVRTPVTARGLASWVPAPAAGVQGDVHRTG